MILIPCTVKCDQCGTTAPATLEVAGCGMLSTGLFGAFGSPIGEIKTTPGWMKVGLISQAVVCSNPCEEAWVAKTAAEAKEREESRRKT